MCRLTGFPLYDEGDVAPLSADLQRFLEAGDPPIAFTPGSANWQGRHFLTESAGACRLLGRRGILLTRHREHVPDPLPPGVIHVDFAPFSRLLPRCAAVVHHGGIGSAAQGLAAGVPQLAMPMAHDQLDNATRLKRLGVARWVAQKAFGHRALQRRSANYSHRPACGEAARRCSQDSRNGCPRVGMHPRRAACRPRLTRSRRCGNSLTVLPIAFFHFPTSPPRG